MTSVLTLLMFAAPAAVKPDPYVMRDVRWETVPAENGDTGKVTLPDGRSVTLRLVRAGGSDELRATCPAKTTKPARYLLAGPALVMGSYPEPVRDSRGRWVFAPTVEFAGDPARRTWALDAPRCRIERLTSSLDAAGFDRFEFARSKPEDARAWLTDNSPFTSGQQSWLAAEGQDPGNAAAWLDRYRTLRPPAAKGRQQTELPPEGGSRATIDGPDGKESVRSTEQARWRITGPARLLISARRLGDAESLCLTVGADSYCQAPAPEIITRIDGGAISVRPAVLRERSLSEPVAWRVLVGEGEYVLGLSGPAVVRATRAELWREGSLPAVPPAQPVVYPPTCLPGAEENACRAPGTTISVDGDPSEVLLASPSVPGAGPEQNRWVEIEEARTIITARKGSWVDERGTSSFWIAGPAAGSTTEDERCVATFADGSRFVSRLEQGVVRFVWNGSPGTEGAMPAFTGCRVWVSIRQSPDDAPPHSPALSLRRFQRIPPGAIATWAVAEPSAPTAVWLAWPQGERGPIDVIAHFQKGESRTTRVLPLKGTPTVLAPDGLPWQPPGRFPLGAGVTRLEVRTNSLCAARVTQTSVARPTAPPEKHERALAGGALLGEVRRLSAGIAHAKSGNERSFLLLERATLLEGAGFDLLALDDLRLAKQGDPTLSPIPIVTVERVMARVLAPSGGNSWMVLDAAWMKEREGAPLGRELLGSARAGNYVDVARTSEAITLDERLRAWRRAVTGGQVLTADQRARSFLDLMDATGEIPVHPLFWPLRSLSSWESIIKVDGAKPVKASSFHLVEDAGLERVQAALFPEEWPSHLIANLEGDRELALPKDAISDLQVRCRATSAENVSQPCAFELVDRKGAVLAQAWADPWGPAATLTSPKNAGAMFLIARPARGAVKQVLLPPSIAEPLFDDARRAWKLESGATASLEVLGPTVVRVAARSVDSSSAILSWEVRDAKSSRRVGGDDTVEILVPHAGRATLSLRADAPVIFAAEMRVPRARSVAPSDDVRLLLQMAGNGAGRDAIRGGAPELPAAQRTYRPARLPPFTIYAGTGAGSEQALDETTFDTRYRGLFEAGITSRLGKLPMWGNAEAEGIGFGGRESVNVARTGFDWLPVRGHWDVWLTADAQLAQGAPGDVALSSHEETARLQVGRWNTPQWLLYGRVRGTNRAILDGEDRQGTGFGEQPILWSTYRDDHPQAFAGAIGTRYVFGQWVLASATAGATTNSSDDETSQLDHADLEASVDLSAPRVWLRVGGVLERRFADDHRLEDAWNPVLEARAWGMVWPIGDVGMQLTGDVRYQTETKDVAAFVTLRLYYSRDRGLRDLRPSRFASRDTAGWDQDRAAVRQYEGDVE